MRNISYQGDHKEFVKNLFSVEYVLSSKIMTLEFLQRLFDRIAIGKKIGSRLYPTDLFCRLNNVLGDRNINLDYELLEVFSTLEVSSEIILASLVADIISSEQENLDQCFGYFKQQNCDVQGMLIEELFARQHDTIPEYLQRKLSVMNFASEFDLSDGQIDLEYFREMSDEYVNYLKS